MLNGLLGRTLSNPAVQKVARFAARQIDLQGSMVFEHVARAAPRARGRLLDVGCGDKPYEPYFRPYVTEYVGIEHEAVFFHTTASVAERRPDLFYDGERLPFPDGSFQTVLSVQVLEHTPHPDRLVKEMARVVSDDGLVIISAPFSLRLHEEPHDFFRYTPHGLRAMCIDAHLEVTEVWKQGDIWCVLAHKLNSFLAFRVMAIQNAAQRVGLLKHEPPLSADARLWLVPLVFPTMLATTSAARILDRVAPDGTEALSYTIFARRSSSSR
jgi:SAM-dependent methyltransferase